MPGRSRAIGGEIDAGQHDLGDSPRDQRARLARRLRPSGTERLGAAPEGDDAEGAAMVAALLHLDEGAGAALEAVDQLARRLSRSAARMSPTRERARRVDA